MKYLLLLPISFLPCLFAYSQQKTIVLIVSSQEGKLLVDGTEQAWLKSSEPAKLSLEDGDHIIQLKTSSETFTKTITCSDGKQRVINFDPATQNAAPSANSTPDLQLVADIQLDLPGSLADPHVKYQVFSFDEGDEISFDFDMLNKNGTVNIYMHSYPDNGLIYSKEKITAISEENIMVPKRGVYYFAFSTNHIVGRSAHFIVRRKPRSEAGRNFKTSVRVKYDTTYQEVQNDQVHVYSQGNLGHSNRTIVRINLPAQTTYWVYWIGVGQESEARLKQFATQLSGAASRFAFNPLFALGMRLIPSLPMFNSTATVNYRFADNANSELFFNGNQYSYYTFKEGINITTDHSIEKTNAKEMNLCLWNNSQFLGNDVKVWVVAFIVKATYIPGEE